MRRKLRFFWNRIRSWYYRVFQGITTGLFEGSLLPEFGEGKYVSVLKKGSYIDIVNHADYPDVERGTLRVIPCQYNHGFFVEFIDEKGNNRWRSILSYKDLFKWGTGMKESKEDEME